MLRTRLRIDSGSGRWLLDVSCAKSRPEILSFQFCQERVFWRHVRSRRSEGDYISPARYRAEWPSPSSPMIKFDTIQVRWRSPSCSKIRQQQRSMTSLTACIAASWKSVRFSLLLRDCSKAGYLWRMAFMSRVVAFPFLRSCFSGDSRYWPSTLIRSSRISRCQQFCSIFPMGVSSHLLISCSWAFFINTSIIPKEKSASIPSLTVF